MVTGAALMDATLTRRRIVVTAGEMTCTGCGEIAVLVGRSWGTVYEPRCPRCGSDDEGMQVADPPPLVPTTSYLHEHEYVIAG